MMLSQSSLRLGPMGGCLGLDMGVIVQVAQARGYDVGRVIDLVGGAQSIIVEKINEKMK